MAQLGQALIFKGSRSADSLCIHEIDHSGLSETTRVSSPSDSEEGEGGRRKGLRPHLAPPSRTRQTSVRRIGKREREIDLDSSSVSTHHDSPMALLIKRETEILSTVASERAR